MTPTAIRQLPAALTLVWLMPMLSVGHAQQGEIVFTCQIQRSEKRIEVRDFGSGLSYAFGKNLKRPELQVSKSYSEWAIEPWAGVGINLYNSISFENNGVKYEIYDSFDRIDLKNDYGIIVSIQGKMPIFLRCLERTVVSQMRFGYLERK